ncbi:MAG: PPC domain-containing protein [Chthonomonadales bacterium]|nr:PPC domain-containing protein [Chthonomonadales bacterium]
MNTYRFRLPLCLAALLAFAPGTSAQRAQQSPHIGYLFPAGGRQGASLDITVGGQLLRGAAAVVVSGEGVRASVGAYDRPLTPREVRQIRDRLQEARKKLREAGGLRAGGQRPRPGEAGALMRLAREAGITDAQVRALIDFQRARTDPKRQPNPQIAEKVTLQVTIDPRAKPGPRELRLLTAAGLSNPLRFDVGQAPERREREPNDAMPQADDAGEMPTVINGQILPGDLDRFALTARKGQRLVFAVDARALVPYLADAVPGWFQATLTLYDAQGREVAFADDFRFDPDPVLFFVVPADGRYTLEVRDAIYRGREDFVYRITLGELPFVTSIFPLGGREGTRTAVALRGVNLPTERLAVEAGAGAVCVRRADLASNRVPFAEGELPERAEVEPNDRRARSQAVALPAIVNGRIDRTGDADVYRFEGRAGQEIVAEIEARRLGSPLDSGLELTDVRGRRLAANDDHEDRGAGLVTHQADSYLRVRLPATGACYLAVRDVQGKGGPEYGYRLRLGPPQPDFALRVVPSSISGRAGVPVPITVYALRRDGFSGGIALELKDALPGFALSGARVPAGQDRVRLTLTPGAVRQNGAVRLEMEGSAEIGGRAVRHRVVPAEDMMQAFAYRHLVPAAEWLAAVGRRGPFGAALSLRDAAPVRLLAGGSARVRLTGYGRAFAAQMQLVLSDPPEGIAIESVAEEPGGVIVTLRADAAKAKPGTKGNLIVEVYREVSVPAANKRAGATRRAQVGTLPAIPFEIARR